MAPEQMIEAMRAARKLGATFLSVRDDGLDVDFGPMPAKRARKVRAKAGAVPEQAEMPDVVERIPKLTEAQLDQLLDAAMEEYVP